MNLTSTIGKNCRAILREHFSPQSSMNTWHNPIPTNPLHSLYGIDHLRVPLLCCEQPSFCNTLLGLTPKIPWMTSAIRDRSCENRQRNCIQTITNCIIHRIRCQIRPDEMSLLCCCLPSLIRQIMCNSPWLTPNDIVQCLSADIIKESMNCVDPNDDHRRSQQREEEKNVEDQHSIQGEDDANVSAHSSRRNSTAGESNYSSKSNLNVPGSRTTQKTEQSRGSKTNQSRTPSTRSFTSQRNENPSSDTQHSNLSPTWDDENQSHRSERNPPGHSDEDATSFDQGIDRVNPMENTPIDSMENLDRKSASRTAQSESIHPSSRSHLEYPGKKDANAIHDVEKCLAFYQQMREHFDDDIAAMLLKCCLCYGDCSGKK